MSQLTFGSIPEPPTGSGCPGHHTWLHWLSALHLASAVPGVSATPVRARPPARTAPATSPRPNVGEVMCVHPCAAPHRVATLRQVDPTCPATDPKNRRRKRSRNRKVDIFRLSHIVD